MKAAIFAYAWDFVDEGVDELLSYLRGLGIGRVLVTSQYHAGFFMHPHNPKRKTHLLEDGVTYYHPDPAIHANTVIKPQIAKMCRDRDWYAHICDRAAEHDIQVSAWHVCMHNTRIGLLHPEATIQNVYGDSYPHALSPGHPDARAYVLATVADVARRYPLAGILPEAPDYRRRAHGADWVSGHHHERDGVYMRPLEQALMDVSFNPADVAQGEAAGIDVESIRCAVRKHMDAYFEAAPIIPDNLPETIETFRESAPALVEYEAYFRSTEAAFLAELQAAVAAHGVKLEHKPTPVTDWVFVGGYGSSPAELKAIADDARSTMLPHQRLNVAMRLGFNHPGMGTPIVSEADTCAMVQAAADGGADEVVFYNYGEAPKRSVDWIKPALASVS